MSMDDFYLTERTMNLRVAAEMKDAEASRLASIAMPEGLARHRVCCAALIWLGSRLVTWGHKLEDRYGNPPTSQLPRTAGHIPS
jgi:hypothetical protein